MAMVKASEIRHLPRQIDVLKLCQQGQTLEGVVPLEDLPRVSQLIPAADSAPVLHPVLRFERDDEGHLVMRGNFAIHLPVVCQRCLEGMDYPIHADFHCAFVASDEKAKGLPAHLEPVVLETDSTQVELYDLLEDELLLNLPIAAFHESCDGNGSPKIFGEQEIQQADVSEKPFAVLAELLNGKAPKKE